MIELHQFAPAWGINISPFCLKIETYLRLTRLPFRPVPTLPQKSPKGKLPFIVDGDRTIADSGHIIEYLKTRYGDPLDWRLSPAQAALGHLVRRTCEESLYFVFLYSRWIDEAGWQISAPAVFAPLPAIVRLVGPYLVRRSIKRTLYRQGYGRHDRKEIYALGTADLGALAAVLNRNEFVVGDEPSSFDACLFGFLVNILRAPHYTPLKRATDQLPVLRDYLARVDARLETTRKPADPIQLSRQRSSGGHELSEKNDI